jgi:glucosamine--fructose-6-phosphate aminotransferase (isomerizing)
MCGIIGYLGSSNYTEFILTGLKLLQNRGYDSVGTATIECDKLKTVKFASIGTNDAITKLEEELISTKESTSKFAVGIGHTRWATHGPKTDINAHPHHDNKDRIALVHNGIIENYSELKKNLLDRGYVFRSQTDTEVIAVLIGKYLDEEETVDNAIMKTAGELMGTWALVIIHKDFPENIWALRNGSPLLLGISDEFVMVASEHIAFGKYINKYIIIDDNDLIKVVKKGKTISYNIDIEKYSIKNIKNELIELTPTNYRHWMLKEISEQPDSIIRALNNGARLENSECVKLGGLEQCSEILMGVKHLILLGCGTSYNSGKWSMKTFKQLEIFETVTIYDGAEFTEYDIPKRGKTAIIFISQSGETKDLHNCIHIAKHHGVVTIGVVNVPDSLIAREVNCGVYLNSGREVAVASTKSFTNQCVVLTIIAIWFSQNKRTCVEKRKAIIADLRNLSFQLQIMLNKQENNTKIKNFVKELSGSKSIFLLGKGKSEAIAHEGALKLKEIAYIHSEGYSSSALKHGTFALIENGLPVIIIDVDSEHSSINKTVKKEVEARGARTLLIKDNGEGDLNIEKNKTFGGLMANVYIQLISYYIALEMGHDPDFPKNLAKVVTVD